MTLPTQPKDPNDDLYKVLKQFLARGDQKIVAIETEVDDSTVSQVVKGKRRCANVWDALMKMALKRKAERDAYLQHMGQPAKQ